MILFQVLDFTYPPGSHRIPPNRWETRASLTLTDLPSSLSICGAAFAKSFVMGAYDNYVTFFRLYNEDDKLWWRLSVGSGLGTGRIFSVSFGRGEENVFIKTNTTLPRFFPWSWVRACVTFDTAEGVVRIVADGEVFVDASYPKLRKLAGKMPRNATIRVGEYTSINSMISDLNVFSELLSLEQMVAITNPGGKECGSRGDLLNWDEAKWTLSDKWASDKWADWELVINASKLVEFEWIRGPCWRPSKIKVYQMRDLIDHSDCMKHCQKIGYGRSPSVVTQEDWRWLRREVEPLTNHRENYSSSGDIIQLLWLAATEGDSGEPL